MAVEYRYLARNRAAFIAQIVRYISRGYYFYICCQVPEGKFPEAVDEKLLARYDVRQHRWRRERRNLKDAAAVHYLRFDRTFVLMLTKGRHDAFYADHRSGVQDIRRQALYVFGYSIRFGYSEFEKRFRTFVRLDRRTYAKLKSHLVTVSTWDSRRERQRMEREFRRIPYQPYGPVIEQLQVILRAVNRARRRRGFAPIESGAIPRRLQLTRVFVDAHENRR
jgi:hypothetical protein